MGKKKGKKGPSQPQDGSGDHLKSGESSSTPEASTSQEQLPKASQEQKKEKQGKEQQVVSPSTSGPIEGTQAQQAGPRKQKQKKKFQEAAPQGETPPQRASQPQGGPPPQQPQGGPPPQQGQGRPQPQGGPPPQQRQGRPQPQQAQAYRSPQPQWAPQQQQQPQGPYPQQQFAPPQQLGSPQPYWGPPPVQQGPPHQQFGGQYPMHPQQPSRPAWGQQQRGPPPGMQQLPGMRPQSPPQGLSQPPRQQGPHQQQQRPPQQQQQRPPQQQQQRPPQQQQQRSPQQQQPPQQQQQRPPQQQQQRPPQQQQQQQRPPQQQQQRPPQQQQQRPPQQQQQRPSQQQQQRPPQQQQQRPPQQQQQRPPQQQPQRPGPSQEQAAASKEASPPLGQGDRLKSLALVTPGTRGRRIGVESNHLALDVGKLKNAFHYDVSIVPDTPKSLLRDVMNAFRQKHYPNRYPAFDGRKNLYSPTKLPFDESDSKSDNIKVDGENSCKEFKVEVKLARTVDLSPLHDLLRTRESPQDALQCLDIVLRNAPSNSCIIAGRCFFTPPSGGQILSLGDGMEMYYGFYQSAIRGWKPLLNVDVAHKAFPKCMEVLDLICELGSDYRTTMTRKDLNRPLNDYLKKNLEKFLKTLKIKYEITGQSSSKRIYRVNGLGQAPQAANFTLEDGKTTTVDKYFQNVKRTKLRYPHLPTLWVGARNRDSPILLPVEFCTIVEGQAINRKMNENQTSAMIKKSATSTEIRKEKIMDTLRKARFNEDPCIREFGFSVNNQFEKLDARVLSPPSLLYAEGNVVKPQKGVWRSDRSKFLNGARITKWTIACVTRQPCKLEALADMIYKMAGSSGMVLEQKATQPFTHIGGRQSLQDITTYFKSKQDCDLIFVVVPNSGVHYSYVKKAAELNVGCLTQCLKERTLFKLNTQTVVNILLKVNSKMNGTNHCFSVPSRPPILERPCMIMGADVTHPSPDARDIPSVAAVTASHDPKAFQYNICWRLQPPRMEIIEDLYNITIEQLNFFYKKTGCKPERIVFFRDGVSEGQFREVQRAEIRAIQNACKKIQADGYEPAITFLVVQKRHHTRLFPTNPRDSEDRNMNVPAGTCVDTHITNPTMQDFYLVSHASIQGVAKPTKYCTLWDDNKMSNDDIEELTYHLCHMFTRCNRSVSYPAPTYYAHLAAARAKVYIENERLDMDRLRTHQNDYQIKECISKGKPMFFV